MSFSKLLLFLLYSLQSQFNFANFIFSTFRDDLYVWIWTTYDGNEFIFGKDDAVRFRVEAEVWHDLTPQKPSIGDEESTAPTDSKKSSSKVDESATNVPYTIIVSDSYHKDYQSYTDYIRGIDATTRTRSYRLVVMAGRRRSRC